MSFPFYSQVMTLWNPQNMHMTLNYEVFKFTKYQLDIVPSIFLSAFLGFDFFIIECYYMYLYVLSNLEWPNWLQVMPLTIYLYILSNYVFSWLPKVGIEPMTIICVHSVGFEPRTFSKNISWTLIPFHWAKCPIEKNSAPPEMAGVPLPTCSGVRAIHDPQ
jgi:hypothetical protein